MDYAVASLLGSGSAFMLFVEQTTPLLAWAGLLLGVLIGVQRFMRNWKHWHRPPGA